MVLNPVNDQFQIGQPSFEFNRSAPSVASAPNGDFVAVWHSDGEDGDGFGIFGQRFQADGTPIGTEFQVNTFTQGGQFRPTVDMDANGNFVVAWDSEDQDRDGYGIYAQRFQANGNRIGSEFLVNTRTEGEQNSPKIAVADNGNFTIVWSGEAEGDSAFNRDVFGRSFTPGGVATAQEFQINEFTEDSQANADITIDAVGNFAVIWESGNRSDPGGPDGDGLGIVARLFSASGNPSGDEVLINATTRGEQTDPAIALAANGSFVATWTDYDRDTFTYRLVGRRLASGGSPITTEIVIDSDVDESRSDSTIGIDDNGNFVVAWSEVQLDGSRGDVDISARRYNADGTPDSAILRVNNIDNGYDTGPAISSDADGDIIIAWSNNEGIAARQYIPRAANTPNNPSNPSNPNNPSNSGNTPNRQIGTASVDRLRGSNNRDVMKGLGGDDRLLGRGGNDVLVGGNGDDVVNGGGGNDRMKGNGGSDRLLGKAGNDNINGGGGNDIIDGGAGVDVVRGGGGRDEFVLRRGNGLSRIKDFGKGDRLQLKGSIKRNDLMFTAEGNGTLINQGKDELAFLAGVQPEELSAKSFT